MSELAERSKKLRSEIGIRFSALVSAIVSRDLDEQERLEAKLVSEIEQALLAERRLAMEEAAKIADAYRCDCPEHVQHLEVSAEIAELIRAAAEKEVAK